MTPLATQSEPDTSSRAVEQLADVVEELACSSAGGCLVEGDRGKLVAHALHSRPSSSQLQEAVLSGDLRGLHAALGGRRTMGLLASGAVIEGVVDGTRVAQVSLGAQAGVWLLIGHTRQLELSGLQEPLDRLAALLAVTGPSEVLSPLAALLCGEAGVPLPAPLTQASSCWVAAAPHSEVTPRATSGVLQARCGSTAYLVVSSCRELSEDEVVCRLTHALGTGVTVGLSAALAPSDLALGKRQADLALREAAPGTLSRLSGIRSVLVVRAMAEAAPHDEELGADPLGALLDYDARRGGDLVESLGAWLDAFGDISRAAEQLMVHPNTLRYRLRRAREVMGADVIDDPFLRTEIHARLLVRS